MVAGYEEAFWGDGAGRRLVEELDSDDDDDSDTQGAGLISTRGARFSSDPLRFTGIDMGENMARPRRAHAYEESEDQDSSGDSDQDTVLDEEGNPQFTREEEDALVDSAMKRIRRAQASGKKDVRLSRNELAALEFRRKRMQAEGDAGRKKKREPRYAVPLSQLAPISHKEGHQPGAAGGVPSVEPLDRLNSQPPVGWFAHPSSSRPGTSDSRRRHSRASAASDREGSLSPFQYNYVQHPIPVSNPRHTSDPALRPRSSRGTGPYEDPRMSQYNPSASMPSVPASLDPFRYMTSAAQVPHHAVSASSLRNVSGSSAAGQAYPKPFYRGGGSASRRQSRHFTPDVDDESSSEEDDSEDDTSDEVDEGARIGSTNAGPATNGREHIIVEVAPEPTPEPRVTRSKKIASSAPSPRASPKASPKRRSGGNRRKKSNK